MYSVAQFERPALTQDLRQSARPFSPSSSQLAAHLQYHDRRVGAVGRPSLINSQTSASPAPVPATSASTSMSFRYYQPPKPTRIQSDSEDTSSEEESYGRRGSRKKSNASSQSKRGACTHCKGLKVKCHFTAGQMSCQRCNLNKLQCVVNGRKKRRSVATHEELLLKSHKQDIEISNLLKQFDELTTEKRIQQWVAKANHSAAAHSPTSHRSPGSSQSSDTSKFGASWSSNHGFERYSSSPSSQFMDINGNYLPTPPSSSLSPANTNYLSTMQLLDYFPDNSVTKYSKAPEIVMRGFIHPADVGELFQIYFKFINPYFSILDPYLHTPEKLFWHSHFLFTVVCAIATKYSDRHAARYSSLLEFARDAAGKALVQGRKTVDECQAFLLIAVYQAPRKRWEDQRGWLHMGIAFSLAQELKLNEPLSVHDLMNSPEGHRMDLETAERTCLNRTRTWLNCYCVDASHSTQFGKPAMLATEDYVARQCREWYHSSPYNLAIDVHLVSYVEILYTMRHFRAEVEKIEVEEKEHPRQPKKVKEVREVVDRYNGKLSDLQREWSTRFATHPQRKEYMCDYRRDTNRMNNAFCRLVVLFYGLQRAIAAKKGEEGGGVSRDDRLVRQCIDAAQEVIMRMTHDLYPTQMLRYSMEAHFLFVTFAAAHLLTLLRPDMSILLKDGDPAKIDQLIRELVDVLRSKEVATDGRQTPYLYARYLMTQLKKFSPLLPPLSEEKPPESQNYKSDGNGSFGLGYHYTFGLTAQSPANDVMYSGIPPSSESAYGGLDFQDTNADTADSQMYSLSGIGLDFSLQYFMQTVNEPQFTKSTPPPGEDTAVWWQSMYPVNNRSLPGACEWPMAVEGYPEISATIPQSRRHSPAF